MLADQRRMNDGRVRAVPQLEAQPVEAERGHLLGAQVGVGRAPERDHLGARPLRHVARARIVRVEHRQPALRQARRQQPLDPLGVVERAEALKVRRADIGHDADVRARRADKQLHLRLRVGPEFEHRPAVLRAQTEDRNRQPDVAVEIARRLIGRKVGGEQLRGRLADGGLAHAAGDPHHCRRLALAPGDRRPLQRRERVRHRVDICRRSRRNRLRDQHRPRAAGDRIIDVAVPVAALARQRHKQRARLHLPRVDHDARKRLRRSAALRQVEQLRKIA